MEAAQNFAELAKQVIGFIYPNEIEIHWSILIVVYPYITGLVAGAFILASLVKVFNVKEVQPTYRLAMLTALAFMLIAPLPLVLHLSHPERAFEMFLTPSLSSAMAMFSFVYLWYLMLVLLLEIYFEYRRDMIVWSSESTGLKKWVLRLLSLFSTDISEKAAVFDKKTVKIITIIGIPSAFLLHGYVGFIFGSVKANPWWSSVMMPVAFLFSAIVSGIAMVMLLYMVIVPLRGGKIDMKCLDKMASFLFYTIIIDFAIEAVDFINRLYESSESIKILSQLVVTKLFLSLVVLQILLGMMLPLGVMVIIKIFRLPEEVRKLLYFVCGLLIQLGIFSTRWNVVIGGQLFSKSFRGLTTYKMDLMGLEGFIVALALLIAPFVILSILIKLLPPWKKENLVGS
jgi:Ni/Fe-hydrogenase subunit HybB-like protein